MTDDIIQDPEIKAMDLILRALAGLELEEQLRAVTWVMARINYEHKKIREAKYEREKNGTV